MIHFKAVTVLIAALWWVGTGSQSVTFTRIQDLNMCYSSPLKEDVNVMSLVDCSTRCLALGDLCFGFCRNNAKKLCRTFINGDGGLVSVDGFNMYLKDSSDGSAEYATFGEKLYKFMKDVRSVPEAVNDCSKIDGQVAMPMNEAENNFIDQLVPSEYTFIWLFAEYRDSQWYHTSTGLLLDYIPTGVNPGPVGSSDYTCLGFNRTEKGWQAHNCLQVFPFVCEIFLT